MVPVIVLVVAFVVDSNIGYIADFIPDFLISNEGIALFIGIAVVYAVGGIMILRYVKATESEARALHLSTTNKAVTVAQYVLIAITAFIIAQILASAQYHTMSLAAILCISYGLWIVTLALLARAFTAWLRSSTASRNNKRNLMVLILTLSMIAYVVNGVTLLASYLAMLQEQQKEVVTSEDVAFFPEFDPESLYHQINLAAQISSTVAYVLTWIGTVMLLQPYIKKIGTNKFYAIMGAAMLYYIIIYPVFVLGYFTPITEETDTDVMNNILIFGMASVLSGIIFGVAFISVARTLQKGSALRQYMIIAACGFVLFYVAGSATVTQLAYPPYGLASVAFTGLACYLIYSGLYSAAISVSQDFQLRESIRRSAMHKHSKFLENIGTAHMEEEKHNLVMSVSRRSEMMEQESGVESSMTEDDMQDYLGDVLKEIEVMREKEK